MKIKAEHDSADWPTCHCYEQHTRSPRGAAIKVKCRGCSQEKRPAGQEKRLEGFELPTPHAPSGCPHPFGGVIALARARTLLIRSFAVKPRLAGSGSYQTEISADKC